MKKLISALGIISSMAVPAAVSAELLPDYSAYNTPQSAPAVTNTAELKYFTDREEFLAICEGETETFDITSASGFTAIPKPLDQYSDNDAYSPGSILPGIVVSTPGGILNAELVVVGPGVFGAISYSVHSNIFSDTLNLSFPDQEIHGNVTCVGMDLGSLLSASTLDLSIHGAEDVSLGETTALANTTTSVFWGVVSTIGVITRIHLASATFQSDCCTEGVDNVTFGTAETATLLSCAGGSFEPPFAEDIHIKKRSRRSIPVKMVLVNDATGELVREGDITPPLVNVAAELSSAIDVGEFRFDVDEDHWVYILRTRDYSEAGVYTVTAVPGDETYTIDAESCVGVFTRML